MVHRQPSLFGVDASDPGDDDLVGLLAGPGECGRMGGTARVSVAVAAAWRVHVLMSELAARGLPAAWEPVGGADLPDGYVVRTAYTVRLLPLVRRWSAVGERVAVPLHLSGHALRLWVAAAGEPSPDGYLLGLGARDEGCWPAVGAALQSLGLPAALVAPAAGPRGRSGAGPAYRITGRRRLARLAELVGQAPAAAPPDTWPTAPIKEKPGVV